MEKERNKRIEIFAALGDRLADFGHSPESAEVIGEACRRNEWFSPGDVLMAVEAIRSRMLDRDLLREWLGGYPTIAKPRDVGVIAAGNILLVGFFDILCIAASGHNCLVRPSSKDAVLTGYVISLLKEIAPEIPIRSYEEQPLDAIIATGSDNTVRYFKSRYKGIPSLFRGSRTSLAIIDGGEGEGELTSLGDDIFSYSSLGCRNVSQLLVPQGYDVAKLARILSRRQAPNRKYYNNYLQRRAVLTMEGSEFIDGGFFLMRRDGSFPAAISEITYDTYLDDKQLSERLAENDDKIQCVVGSKPHFPRSAGFGQSQYPTLTDYPDGADVMQFLCGL